MAHTHQTVSFGFNLTKNIPIDKRFKINSLATVDTEIPVALRYEGLIFICEDGQVNYQNDKSRFYTFDANLKPILLFDYLNRRVKLGLEVEPADYPNLNTVLDQNCYPVLGTMVYITPLDIVVKWNGNKWETILGSIKVKSSDEYISLPDNFKNQGFSVIINNGINPEETKIILDDLKLSDVVIVGKTSTGIHYGGTKTITDLSGTDAQDTFWTNNPDLNRFFLIDHALFFNLNGTLYQVNEDIIVTPCHGETPVTVYKSKTFCSEKPEAYFVLKDYEKRDNSTVAEIFHSTYPDIENYGSDNIGETVYGENSVVVEVGCHFQRGNMNNGYEHTYTLDIPKSDFVNRDSVLNRGLVEYVVIVSGMSMGRMQQKGVGRINPVPSHTGGNPY